MNGADRNQTATLGCGTLILIALIVLFFSKDSELRDRVGGLQKASEAHSKELTEIQEKLDRLTELVKKPDASDKKPDPGRE